MEGLKLERYTGIMPLLAMHADAVISRLNRQYPDIQALLPSQTDLNAPLASDLIPRVVSAKLARFTLEYLGPMQSYPEGVSVPDQLLALRDSGNSYSCRALNAIYSTAHRKLFPLHPLEFGVTRKRDAHAMMILPAICDPGNPGKEHVTFLDFVLENNSFVFRVKSRARRLFTEVPFQDKPLTMIALLDDVARLNMLAEQKDPGHNEVLALFRHRYQQYQTHPFLQYFFDPSL